jgi:predicted DNA-binding protein
MATTIENTTELTMKVRLSKQASEKLNKRATESGRDVAAIASDLIEQAIAQPSLEELLVVSQAEFASTGMTESEMMDFGRELLGKVRSAKASGA